MSMSRSISLGPWRPIFIRCTTSLAARAIPGAVAEIMWNSIRRSNRPTFFESVAGSAAINLSSDQARRRRVLAYVAYLHLSPCRLSLQDFWHEHLGSADRRGDGNSFTRTDSAAADPASPRRTDGTGFSPHQDHLGCDSSCRTSHVCPAGPVGFLRHARDHVFDDYSPRRRCFEWFHGNGGRAFAQTRPSRFARRFQSSWRSDCARRAEGARFHDQESERRFSTS